MSLSFVGNLKGNAFSAAAAIERLAGGRNRAHGLPLSEIRKFLVLQHASALGTVIHATPLFSALRHAIPDAQIAVAASGFSLDALRNNPNIDTLIETPSPLKYLKLSVRSLRRQFPFRDTAFATITPMGNERTLVALQAMLSGGSNRIGFTVQPELFRLPMTYDGTSQIANNLRIVKELGHAPTHFEPRIFFSEQDAAYASGLLEEIEEGQPIAVFVTQTSVTQRKGWRAERFHAAASFLKQHYGAHIVFVGTSAESQAIDRLREGLPFITTNVAGKTNLPQLTALMSLATIGLTLDTGPLHIGRAAGLPMVIIAPAWSPVIEWLPVDNERYRILKNADLPTAPADYIIDEVGVDEVIAALTDLLKRFPNRPASVSKARRGS